MPKSIVSSNLEVASDRNAKVLSTEHTFGKNFSTNQNVAIYVRWRLSKLEDEHKQMLTTLCCKVRPRCHNCALKRKLLRKSNPAKRMGIINEILYNQYLTEIARKKSAKRKKNRGIKDSVSV